MSTATYTFGEFVVDTRNARLLRDGTAVAVEPKALRALVYLIRHSDRLVTKGELLDRVWEGAVVSENTLTRTIARLRQVLGDDAHDPRFIETAHTLGYRFIAPVTDGLAEGPESSAGERRCLPRRLAGRLPWLLLALFLGTAAVLLLPRGDETPVPAPARPMIAVLPFDNLGPPSHQGFAAGITDEITTRLATLGALGVISRRSSASFAGSEATSRKIGDQLGADYLLSGTVRWPSAGTRDRVRITVRLIRVADDSHLWAETYDRVLDDILELQVELALEVARRLDVRVAAREQQALAPRITVSQEAYNAYLRGRARFGIPHPTAEDLKIAAKMFARAVELDPELGIALAWESMAYSGLYQLHEPSAEHASRARDLASQAAARQPALPQAYLARSLVHLYIDRDYPRALEEAEAAERRLPNDPDAQAIIGVIWRRQGRFQEARAKLEQALRLDPRSARLAFVIGWSYDAERLYEEAQEFYDRSIALAPDQPRAYMSKSMSVLLWRGSPAAAREVLRAAPDPRDPCLILAWCMTDLVDRRYRAALDRLSTVDGDWLWFYPRDLLQGRLLLFDGRPAEARPAFLRARELLMTAARERPEDPWIRRYLGLAAAGLGLENEAVREALRAVEIMPISKDAFAGPSLVRGLAQTYAMLGRVDDAVDQLELLLSMPAGRQISVPSLRIDPRWDPLRGDTRFDRLILVGES